MEEYCDLNIRISPAEQEPGETGQSEAYPVQYKVRVSSNTAGEKEGIFELPIMSCKLAGVVINVAQVEDDNEANGRATDDAGSNNRGIGNISESGVSAETGASAKEFGERLYEALFNGEVRSALDQTTSAAYAQNIGTRIRLIMDLKHTGMGELASLPWELMRPKDEDPLVISIKTTLVRSLDVAKPSEPRPFIPPLRILVIMSNPKGTLDLNLEEERSRIKSEWNLLPGVKVDFVSAVVDDLLKQLAAEEYHVVHYMGHGDFDADSGGMLLLERKDGSPHPVSGEKFAIMLSDEPLRLVFLNACNTGTTVTQSGTHPFAGVAAARFEKAYQRSWLCSFRFRTMRP